MDSEGATESGRELISGAVRATSLEFATGLSGRSGKRRLLALLSLVSIFALAGCNQATSVVGPPANTGSTSWTQVTGLTGFYNIAMLGSVMYAAGNYGIFRSIDNGSSWTEVDTALPSGGYTIAAINGKLFIGDYSSGNGIFISSDSGSTWVAADSGLSTSYAGFYQTILCMASVDSTIFAGTSSNGIFKSTDGGRTWHATNDGISYGSSAYSIVSAGPNIITGTQNGTFLSSDGGQSWIANDSGLVNQSPYFSGSPTVASLLLHNGKLYAAALGTQVYLSQNNGLSWTDISGNLPGSAQSGIGIAASDSSLVVIDDNGIFLSRNDGGSWADIVGNLPNAGVYAFSQAGNYIFIQMSDGSVWRLPF